jgi:DNA-directed RNA polymerase subunit beta'
MALELFKPFIFNKLQARRSRQHHQGAKKPGGEASGPEVWDILEEVISEHPVL